MSKKKEFNYQIYLDKEVYFLRRFSDDLVSFSIIKGRVLEVKEVTKHQYSDLYAHLSLTTIELIIIDFNQKTYIVNDSEIYLNIEDALNKLKDLIESKICKLNEFDLIKIQKAKREGSYDKHRGVKIYEYANTGENIGTNK